MEIPDQKPENPMDRWKLVSLASEMGFIIALPLLVFILIGKRLDAKFGTDPWLTIAGILLAIGSTTVWLTKRLKKYIK